GIRSTTYPSYALNLAQLGALCISNLCATKPFKIEQVRCIKLKHMKLLKAKVSALKSLISFLEDETILLNNCLLLIK
ncbi:hypothetical protein NI466_15180, partial [Acinetobacter lwoffii]|nr:hypothetical protein [Acinetobacter lwoffii]